MTDSSHPSDSMRFAALTAHQLKSPIASARQTLSLLLEEYVGPLSAKQKELLSRVGGRCDQALESVERMLAIARAMEYAQELRETTDLSALLRRIAQGEIDRARKNDISMDVAVEVEPAWVRGNEAGLTEVVSALLDNALKYTPARGRIRMVLDEGDEDDTLRLRVEDSGEGIAEADREKVFQPFYRTASASGSSRPGSGMGLSFVKALVEAGGGTIHVERSSLGGAAMVIDLPRESNEEPPADSNAMKVVIVGGVAAGPKVASKIIRLVPDADVTIVERGETLSYAGCGLPYYISGVVGEQRELLSTAVGVVRDPVFFRKVKNVHVLNRTEAVEIDRETHRLRLRRLADGSERWELYDKLVLCTGAKPVVPPIPNVELRNIFRLHGMHDAESIKNLLAGQRARDVVIVGGGLLGVETTEALVRRGCRVTIVEMLPQTLGIMDEDMARLVEQHMESHGVKVMTATRVEAFEGEENVEAVMTDRGRIPADMVILAIGVRPNAQLAKAAGLDLGEAGAIRVDETMRTCDPDIFAAGDCAESRHLVTGRPCYIPLGSTANKQGRVAAVNLCGGSDTFPGVVGSAICRVFEYCVGRTGLTEHQAREEGRSVVSVLVPAPDREHFFPSARELLLKMVVECSTRRLLGVQVAGAGAGDKRIDVAATAITAGMTVDQVAQLDLSYAPPYSSAMDNLITAANVARNKLDGHFVGISPAEVHRRMRSGQDFVFLDVRSPAEYETVRLPNSTWIPLGALRGRLGELSKDRPVVTFCTVSLRGYEASLLLRREGYGDVKVMDGGVAMWPYEKLH